MKSIIDLIRGIKVYEIKSEELPEIYCDLDQVLVNFYEGADAAVKGNFLKMDTKKNSLLSAVSLLLLLKN